MSWIGKYTQHTTDTYRTYSGIPKSCHIHGCKSFRPHVQLGTELSRVKVVFFTLPKSVEYGKFQIPNFFSPKGWRGSQIFGGRWSMDREGWNPLPWANSGDRIFCRVITPDAGEQWGNPSKNAPKHSGSVGIIKNFAQNFEKRGYLPGINGVKITPNETHLFQAIHTWMS